MGRHASHLLFLFAEVSDVSNIKPISDILIDSSITDSEEDHHTWAGSECPSFECATDNYPSLDDCLDDHDVDMNMDFDFGIDFDEFNANDFDVFLQHTHRANELVFELYDDILF